MDRKLRWVEFRVGLFVVLSVVVLTLAVVLLGERTEIFAGKAQIHTFMPNVGGLKTGAPVWLSGVEVGNVDDIQFSDAARAGQIEVTLSIKKSVFDLVRKDSVAYLATKGLLGDKIVSITVGSPTSPPVEPGGLIEGRAPEDLFSVFGKLTEAFDYLDRVARGLDRLAGVVTEGKGSLGQFIRDDHLYTSLVQSVQSLQTLLNSLNAPDGTLNRLAKDPSLYQNLKTSSERLSTLLGRVEAGKGTLGKFVVDPELYEETRQSVTELKELIAEIRKNPKKYFSFSIF